MIDPMRFIKQNFNIENNEILMFDVPASRFKEFNELYGTSFQGREGIISVRIAISDFIKQFEDVFKGINEDDSKSYILTRLLNYDERKNIGHAPFFRYKIMESLKARQPKIAEIKTKPAAKSLIYY